MKAVSVPKKFVIVDFFQYGWRLLKDQFSDLLKIWVVYFLVLMGPMWAAGLFLKEDSMASLIFQVGYTLWSVLLQIGLIKILLKVTRGKKYELSELFGYSHLIIPYLIGTVLLALRMMLGFLLLIVPGVIWSLKFQFVPFLIVDKELGATEAFEASAKMTEGFKLKLFWFMLASVGLNLMGILALFVGLLVTIPVTSLASVGMYHYLSGKGKK